MGSRIAVFYLAAAASGAVYEAIFLPAVGRVEWRGGLLVTIAGVGVLPALAVIAAIDRLAAAKLTEMHAAEVEGIIWSRRLLQRLLAPLGGLIALLVAAQATGAARYEDPSVVVTLIFGGAASTLLAITYAPTAARLRERALALIEALLPYGTASGPTLVELADQRAKAAGLLGADRSLFGDLQTNIAVIGPLIASAAATLLQ